MFILVVERNSIRSQAVKGGNFFISQHDALSGMEVVHLDLFSDSKSLRADVTYFLLLSSRLRNSEV